MNIATARLLGLTQAPAKPAPAATTTAPTPAGPAAPVSPSAPSAVAAALSQLGVPYQAFAMTPGVAFDCSGLTAWAWARAGVSLPHQSGLQSAALPHVAISAAQPGDLLFYHSPISHVALYIGGGRQVHAPATGKTVEVVSVNWGRVVGVARP